MVPVSADILFFFAIGLLVFVGLPVVALMKLKRIEDKVDQLLKKSA